MKNIASLFAVSTLLTGLLLCGCNQRPITTPPHPHQKPLTKTVDHYHVRLIVEQSLGKMWLVFEDISEAPVRAMRPRNIFAKAIMANGKTIKLRFHPVPPPYEKYHKPRKHHKKRLVSLFATKANWIKTTDRFDLAVEFIYGGKHYPLLFRYGFPESN